MFFRPLVISFLPYVHPVFNDRKADDVPTLVDQSLDQVRHVEPVVIWYVPVHSRLQQVNAGVHEKV
jgi:hypothetical protein